MSNEAQIHSSLRIANVTSSELEYQSHPVTFHADVGSGAAGPYVGTILATTAGVSVDLSDVTTPGGFCRVMNLDPTNFVEVGIWDPDTGKFYPMLDILAGETYVFRLAQHLESEYGTGTGTSGADTNALRLKADTAACSVLVEVFDK